MITNFRIIPILPQLTRHVERIFIIESSGKLPTEDLKLIVPNACPKLVIPFKNGLTAMSNEWDHVSKEHKLTFIGVSDKSASVDFLDNESAGSITIELKPSGAYRFTKLNWSDVSNSVLDYTSIDNSVITEIENRIADEENVLVKVDIVQQFLIRQLQSSAEDPIFDFCMQQIIKSRGRVSIAELEKQTGYSSRWLNMKFHALIGISPKNLASITRFQQYYHSLVNHTESFFLDKQFYNYYHDQSHFIRDFKRFTGLSPSFLSRSDNNYDRFFYKD